MSDIFLAKFPPALPKSETVNYFKGNSFYTREDIILGNMRLVLSIVSRYNVSEEEKKDLFQIGLIGLMKAVDNFKIEKGSQFSTFAGICIDNEIKMYLRKVNKDGVLISMDEIIPTNGDVEGLRISDTLVDDKINIVEDYENKETIDLLKQLVVSLDLRDSFILVLYFGLFENEQLVMQEIAFRLNISRSYISRLVQKALINLKELMLDPPKKRKRRGRKIVSIFELLKNYDRDLIWEVINELNEEDRILLYLRNGENLDNPDPSPFWNKNTSYKFNTRLFPKIKRKLEEKIWLKDNEIKIEELSPMEIYRSEKINELHNLLMSMNMIDAQIVLHDYLTETKLIQYENFIVSLIILSVMDKDFTFEMPIRSLVLLENGYKFKGERFKEYFYQSLIEDIAQAPLYLDIITCLQKAGMIDIDIESLDKAYSRVLQIKK